MRKSRHPCEDALPPQLRELHTKIVAAVEDFNDAGEMSPSLRQLCGAIGWQTTSSGSMSAEVQKLIERGVLERVGRTLRIAARWRRRRAG
jgi:hypothetical protein